MKFKRDFLVRQMFFYKISDIVGVGADNIGSFPVDGFPLFNGDHIVVKVTETGNFIPGDPSLFNTVIAYNRISFSATLVLIPATPAP